MQLALVPGGATSLAIRGARLRLGLFIAAKCVKSQNHPPFYTIKILASCGKSLGGHTILQNEASFGGNFHNLCQIWLEGFTRVKTLTFCNSGERPP